MKIIKRYTNRKLYDTESSSYVTLDEIARMVKEGVEFSIIDNRSKRDLTSLTLAQILCEQEKKQSSFLPMQALKNLIRSGEDFFQRRVRAPLNEMRDRTQESLPPDLVPAVREFFEHFQHSLDESLHTVDEQVRRILDGMVHLPELQEELSSLQEELGRIETRVMELEAQVGKESDGSEADQARQQQA